MFKDLALLYPTITKTAMTSTLTITSPYVNTTRIGKNMKPCIPQANNDVVSEDYMSRGDVVNYKNWLDVRSIILVPFWYTILDAQFWWKLVLALISKYEQVRGTPPSPFRVSSRSGIVFCHK